MALNVVPLICDLYDGSGNPITEGYAYFAPNTDLLDTTDHKYITLSPITAAFDNAQTTGSNPYTPATGLPQVSLVATDNAGPMPAGWAWTVSFQLPPSVPQIDPFSFFLPYNGGATVYLSSLAQVPAVPPTSSYLPLPSGTPSAGQVPVATGSGEGSVWTTTSGLGTVTSVSVATANGFAGTVANPTSTPAITVETTVTGLLKGNGTGVTAAVAGTDYDAAGAAAAALASAEAYAVPKAGGTMTGALAPAVSTLTFVGAGTTLVNAALANSFNLTLTASTTTLGTPSNPVDGQVIRLRVTQGGSGSFTLAYASGYDFGAAGTPTLSTAAGKVDVLGFEYVASLSKWVYLGAALGN
jgi:hypothetical protein